MIQAFFNDKEPNSPSTLTKQWNTVLQCRAQSSQVKALHIAGLAATGRDSFAHGMEITGGLMTKLIERSTTIPTETRVLCLK